MTAPTAASMFLPHGAPTFVLRPGAAGSAMAEEAARQPRPRAIVIVSAHWETSVPTVGTTSRPETIHDFYGFPEQLYTLRYPATGAPEVASEVFAALVAAGLSPARDPSRGLDHGAWVPLMLMYPGADVPVVSLSLQPAGGPAAAYRLGQALSGLHARGILVIASGNLTHSLRDYMIARQTGQTPGYVRAFADWFWDRLQAHDLAALLAYRQQAPEAVRAHPTDEHLLPLFVALGAAGESFDLRRFHAGVDDYVLAMDAYAFAPRQAAA